MATEPDYMTLAPGAGVVPAAHRNRAYDKLPYDPGDGGLGDSQPRQSQGPNMAEFLAGIAAGADPQQFAAQLLGANQTGRARRGQKGAAA